MAATSCTPRRPLWWSFLLLPALGFVAAATAALWLLVWLLRAQLDVCKEAAWLATQGAAWRQLTRLALEWTGVPLAGLASGTGIASTLSLQMMSRAAISSFSYISAAPPMSTLLNMLQIVMPADYSLMTPRPS